MDTTSVLPFLKTETAEVEQEWRKTGGSWVSDLSKWMFLCLSAQK